MNPFVFCVADFRFPMTMLQNCDLGKPGALASMGSLAPTRPPLWLCSCILQVPLPMLQDCDFGKHGLAHAHINPFVAV